MGTQEKEVPNGPKRSGRIALERGLKSTIRRNSIAVGLLASGFFVVAASLIYLILAVDRITVTQRVELQGIVRAIEHAQPVSHPTGGELQSLFISEGEVAREGQILASLDTSDLREELLSTRRNVVELLVRAQCLRALKRGESELVLSDVLKQVSGKMRQLREMKRQVHSCTTELQARDFDRVLERQINNALKEVADLYERRAQTAILIATELRSASVKEKSDLSSRISNFTEMDKILEIGALAKEKRIASESYDTQLNKAQLRFEDDITKELGVITDRLSFAREELSRLEFLLEDKFIYAQHSGRIQRVRISEPGTRIAANARIMEIAPLETDFELAAEASVIDLPDVYTDQIVMVQLAGAAAGEKWVPAKISAIYALSQNKRRIMIHLDREDLVRRDLLDGDRQLVGLGEESNALISISAQPIAIIFKSILNDLIQSRSEIIRALLALN